MGNRMPELTLTHFIAGFNSRKRTKNLGSKEKVNLKISYIRRDLKSQIPYFKKNLDKH